MAHVEVAHLVRLQPMRHEQCAQLRSRRLGGGRYVEGARHARHLHRPVDVAPLALLPPLRAPLLVTTALVEAALAREAPLALPVRRAQVVARVATRVRVEGGAVAGAAVALRGHLLATQVRLQHGEVRAQPGLHLGAPRPARALAQLAEVRHHGAHALVEVRAHAALEAARRVEHVVQDLLDLAVLVAAIDVGRTDEAGDIVLQDGEADAQCLPQVARGLRVVGAHALQPVEVARHRMQVREHLLALFVGVGLALGDGRVQRLHLLRGHREVLLVRRVTHHLRVVRRLRNGGEVREPTLQQRRLRRQLLSVRRVLLRAQPRVLLLLVLEVAQRLRQLQVRVVHQLDDLALVEGGRQGVAPVHYLRRVDGHAVTVDAQLVQRVGDCELLGA
mmetsp:Transcript_5836/g.14399  ORF Transcript_5836/g.14399 Transcript_5836/m.14399 type:complete len:390 (+) Transcript_5836:533-1702(+)